MKLDHLPEHDVSDLFGLMSVVVRELPAFACPKGHDPVLVGNVIEPLSESLARHMLGENFVLAGCEVRFLRKHMGITQQRLADLVGVSRVTVARWEAAAGEPVEVPVSIAIRTVLGSMEGAPARPGVDAYRQPPAPHPQRFEIDAPAQLAM